MERDESDHTELKRRMRIMLIAVGILFGAIFIYKLFGYGMTKYFLSHQKPLVSVSTIKAANSSWESDIKVVGSLRAIRGVNVTTELAGMVDGIYFTPGSIVQDQTLLVQLNISTDVAQLQSLQATAELGKITYERDKAQFAIKAISKQTLDADVANLKNYNAQVAQQEAVIQKKTIHAPFSGRLGISAVNPGQYVNPGDKVVTLQQLDPIYIDFYVPQQSVATLKIGQDVTVVSDSFPGKTFHGKVTTIDPLVDSTTRNAEVEATIANPKLELLPGMFATANVIVGAPKQFITLPQTAISFNPYGNIVYLIKQEKDKDKDGKPNLTVVQKFVTTGDTRGDQITVLKGLKVGQEVVTSGQLKLKNGSQVTINNSIKPANNPAPNLPDSY